jgi:ketosteroid isomerase-like protein
MDPLDKMRTLLLVMFLIAQLGSGCAPVHGTKTSSVAAPSPADQVSIENVASAWVSLYNSGKVREVTELYATDGYYVSAHVLAKGHEAIQRYWERGIAAGGHLDFVKPVEIRVEGGLGYFLGRYQATNAGVTVDGRILIVARKIKGVWKIAVHETVVRDQPE